jgi:hypothetical protein
MLKQRRILARLFGLLAPLELRLTPPASSSYQFLLLGEAFETRAAPNVVYAVLS